MTKVTLRMSHHREQNTLNQFLQSFPLLVFYLCHSFSQLPRFPLPTDNPSPLLSVNPLNPLTFPPQPPKVGDKWERGLVTCLVLMSTPIFPLPSSPAFGSSPFPCLPSPLLPLPPPTRPPKSSHTLALALYLSCFSSLDTALCSYFDRTCSFVLSYKDYTNLYIYRSCWLIELVIF